MVTPYDYVPISDRPRTTWPNGADLAVVVTINLETWDMIKESAPYAGGPDTLPIPELPSDHEDIPNYSWREYGPRVGFWRLLDHMDRLDVTVSATLNTQFADRYPEALEAARDLDWEFIAHSTEQQELLVYNAKDIETERRIIQETVAEYEEIFGQRPRGWLSPSLASTLNTPEILAEEGFLFICDWQNDDQPYVMEGDDGQKLVNVPYTSEINDFPIFIRNGNTPDQFLSYVKREFDVLLEESREVPRVFNLGLHPHVGGRPARAHAIAEFLEYVKQHDDAWFAKRETLANWALDQQP